MKKFNKIKLILTALYIGMPLSTVLNNNNEAQAMMKVGSTANRLASTLRPSFKKPPLPPKPTNIPKIGEKFAQKVNRSTSLPPSTPKPNGISERVSSFSSGKISKKIEELNLSAQSPSNLNPTKTANKLNLNSEFKNKLSSIFSDGKPQQATPKKIASVNKLSPNNPEKQKLESLFGGGTSSSNTPSSEQTLNKVFENKASNIPPAPPLPSKTPSNIPPAPPLPTSKESLKPLSNASSIQNLQTKAPEKKMVSRTNSSPLQNNLMEELNQKLQSRKK